MGNKEGAMDGQSMQEAMKLFEIVMALGLLAILAAVVLPYVKP